MLELVVVLLGADLLDVAAHGHADLGRVLDLDPAGPLDGEAELVGALHPRDARGDLEVGHPTHGQDADVALDPLVLVLADDADGAAVGDGEPLHVVGELVEVVLLPVTVLDGAEGERRRESEGARTVQQPLELAGCGRGAVHAGGGHDLVGGADLVGERQHLPVGERAGEPAERLVEALAGGDLDADVDLLVGHAASGEVLLVGQQVVTPCRGAAQGRWRRGRRPSG